MTTDLVKPQSHHAARGHAPRDYSLTPLNVYWETTQACALACRHCRASAMPEADPQELSFEDGVRMLHEIKGFGDPLPHLILTGGDPLAKARLFDLVDEAHSLGIEMSITPAATPALTRDVVEKLKEHGVSGLGLSLDGSCPERHDAIRGVPGTFDRTRDAMRWAAEFEMPLQINTLVSAETVDDLPAIYRFLSGETVSRWSLFFLITVGRGKVLQPLSPEEGVALMEWIHGVARTAPFTVATTEAPSYRRVAVERMRAEGFTGEQIARSATGRGFGIRDGHGIVFVSHRGDICPAGFLPLSAGNIKTHELADVYRSAPLFEVLHDPSHFQGACGECRYRSLCGGSRSRAYAATGDPFGSDPLCPQDVN